jgi:hypothetical protein
MEALFEPLPITGIASAGKPNWAGRVRTARPPKKYEDHLQIFKSSNYQISLCFEYIAFAIHLIATQCLTKIM